MYSPLLTRSRGRACCGRALGLGGGIRPLAVVSLVWFLLAVPACKGPTLPVTPNLYSGGHDPFVGLPEAKRTAELEILYATDRKLTDHEDFEAAYGSERSTMLAVGRCTVTLGRDMDWNNLVEASLDPRVSDRVPLEVTSVRELVRFPSSVSPLVLIGGDLDEHSHSDNSKSTLQSQRKPTRQTTEHPPNRA